MIGGATYLLAKYLAQNLKPLVSHIESFIKDSALFVNELKSFNIDLDEKLVVGIMIQAFSLMATHSDERSQCSRSTTKNYKLNSKE